MTRPREGQTFDGGSRLVRYVNFVKLPHTVFALPFALVGVIIASYRHAITWATLGWVVLAFTAARSETCDRQIDVLQRIRSRYPDVQFAAVSIRGDRDDLRALIRRRGWTLPVAYDHDGGVANAYAVAICPTVTFAYRGGKVQSTSLTLIEGAALRERIEKIR